MLLTWNRVSVRLIVMANVLTLAVVSTLPAQVPRPVDVIGFEPGSDYKLANYDQLLAYYTELSRTSDRVMLQEIGVSTQGRPLIMLLISSSENLRDRERYREISQRLAIARDLELDEARLLAHEGKAIVWINTGLHANEVAHAQHAPLLAHWLATSEEPEARRVRDNAILLLMPVMNPDGLQLIAPWYMGNVGTPFELTSPPAPAHHYGINTNRDWYAFTQIESRAVAKVLFHEWFPQILYDHHQRGPFPGRIWLPPAGDPVNPNIDPLVLASNAHMGQYMLKRFAEESKPGVTTGVYYRALWSSGFLINSAKMHNMVGLFTEASYHAYGTPHCYDPVEFPETFQLRFGVPLVPTRAASVRYPDPWPGGCWHLADVVDYMFTASRAVLDAAAKLKDDYLINVYLAGARQIRRAEERKGGVFAYVVDLEAQHDPSNALHMLRALRWGGVEINRTDRPFVAGGREFPSGVFVIPPQAYWPFIVDHLEAKVYPERYVYPGGEPDGSHDLTGYEMALQMGVDVDRITEPFTIPGRPITEIEIAPPPGHVEAGVGDRYLALPTNSSILAINRLLAAGDVVSRTSRAFVIDGVVWPAGTFVVVPGSLDRLSSLAADLGVTFSNVAGELPVPLARLRKPRIGLYASYISNADEGMIRWVMDQYEFGYDVLRNRDVRMNRLGSYDLIILPDQPAEQIQRGFASGTMPSEFTGGIDAEGVAALRTFAHGGGTVLAFGRAGDFAINTFDLPLRNVRAIRVDGVRGHTSFQRIGDDEFMVDGSLLRMIVSVDHPLAFGMAEDGIALFTASDQIYDHAPNRSSGSQTTEIYARYADSDYLASGRVIGGARYLAGRPAAIRVSAGEGAVILIGFSPQFRGQPRPTFKLLFNAAYAAVVEDQ
jgi:hypothetical protein